MLRVCVCVCVCVTQVMICSYLDRLTQLSLYFKCETFQVTGSFKFRVGWVTFTHYAHTFACVYVCLCSRISMCNVCCHLESPCSPVFVRAYVCMCVGIPVHPCVCVCVYAGCMQRCHVTLHRGRIKGCRHTQLREPRRCDTQTHTHTATHTHTHTHTATHFQSRTVPHCHGVYARNVARVAKQVSIDCLLRACVRVCVCACVCDTGALARAAQVKGIPAHIVVPSTTPQCKVDAVRAYGGVSHTHIHTHTHTQHVTPPTRVCVCWCTGVYV